MKRIELLVIKCLLSLPSWIYIVFKYSKNIERYTEEKRYKAIRKIIKKINKRGKITIVCTGLENLPKDQGYVLFPNHQGLFDGLGIIDTHDMPITLVSKIEVKKIFFVRQILDILQAKYLDREDLRQSMVIMNEVTNEVKQGRNYAIFPEGTRSKNGNNTLEFKAGCFKCAMKAKAPIIPVALVDCFKVFDNNTKDKVTVQIHYLEPLYYNDYQPLTSKEISNIIEERIKEAIEENTNIQNTEIL